jgi:hypothetical protein
MPKIKSTDLQINQPIEANAPDTQLTITVDATSPMKTGTYLFHLEVIDDSGNRSAPAQAMVTVIDNKLPNAIISPPKVTVGFGTSFTLSGKDSTDIGGTKNGLVVGWITNVTVLTEATI